MQLSAGINQQAQAPSYPLKHWELLQFWAAPGSLPLAPGFFLAPAPLPQRGCFNLFRPNTTQAKNGKRQKFISCTPCRINYVEGETFPPRLW